METNETGDQLAAFGRWLVRERELRGLSRDEVARATKLAPGVVEALESGEQARIPPHAYVVGYLRAYAQAVGLDADEVVLRFEEAAGPARPAPAARAVPPARRAPPEAAGPARPGRRASPEAAGPGRRASPEAAGTARAAPPARRAGVPRGALVAAGIAIAAAAAAAAWALLGS
jgi:transcriptional regulator with XRE-family HTH domain